VAAKRVGQPCGLLVCDRGVSSHLLLRLTANEVNNPCKEINRKDELIRDIYGHLCKKRGMKKS